MPIDTVTKLFRNSILEIDSLSYGGYMKKKKAFTLAEVLITLGIIGIVAAMTLPAIVGHYKEVQTISKLKKIYSVFSNAYAMTISEYDTPDKWTDIYNTDENGVLAFWDRLKPYLQIAKECDFNKRFECWTPNSYFIYLNGTASYEHIHNGNQKTFVLVDGTMVSFALPNTEIKPNPGCVKNGNYFPCATILVKTDNARTQIYGKNIFEFRFEHNIVTPKGINNDMQDCYNLGKSCTAWALFNENMDYLKCKGLSWTGKKKCK